MANDARGKRTVAIVLAVALLVVVGIAAGMFLWVRWTRALISARQAKLAGERAARQALITEVAPAKMPESLPLIGQEGKGPDGYPAQYVDVPGLRSLLYHKRFAELTSHFEQFQAAFEADPRKEYWPMDAADAFDSSEPQLNEPLDAWVKATPGSFAPYLARGTHLVSVGYASRGGRWAKDTASEDFAAMGKALNLGIADLDKALALRPHLVAALRRKIVALRADCDMPGMKQALDSALAFCPSCYQVRVAYIYAILPRWCGSYEEMAAFAHYRDDGSNPRMRFLPGYVDMDQADLLMLDKRYSEALQAIQRACQLGDQWEFLLKRAEIEEWLDQDETALADLNRALELRPGNAGLLFARALQEGRMNHWELAGRDLLEGLRRNPTDTDGRRIYENTVKGVIYEGWEAYKSGRREDALRIFDLASNLAPTNQEVASRRTAIVMGLGQASRGVTEIEEQAKKAPDDFRACQQLDYTMARQGRFKEVAAMWDQFIARNPNEGRAYLERGGTRYHMGDIQGALADAKKACDLGVSEGCAQAKKLEATPIPR
jgi:tetratricopeptide (TPR) repeat protein